MANIPPLTTLLAFEAVARRRSFAHAAAELNLTPSAISHQITRLESMLGVKLFDRSAQRVVLSEPGTAYLRRVGAALGAIAAATDDARHGVRNSLYVHASPSFASLWLMPRLPHFAKQHPDVSLYLSSSPTHSDFALGQADIDVRYGVPNWPDLVVHPMFDEQVMPLASPAFLRRRRARTPGDLARLPLIQSTACIMQWTDWFAAQGVREVPDHFPLRFDRAQLSLDAAVQGLGIALESAMLAAPHLAESRLVPLFDASRALTIQGHFLVYPARHARRPEVELFVRWMHEQGARTGSPS